MYEYELSILGKKYRGEFSGESCAGERSYGPSCSETSTNCRWYKGAGLIRELDSTNSHFFTFETEAYDVYSRMKPKDLEEAIVNILNGWNRVPKSRIADEAYKIIIDIACEDIISKVLSFRRNIPKIYIPKLNYRLLVERGLVFAENGQLNFLNLLK